MQILFAWVAIIFGFYLIVGLVAAFCFLQNEIKETFFPAKDPKMQVLLDDLKTIIFFWPVALLMKYIG